MVHISTHCQRPGTLKIHVKQPVRRYNELHRDRDADDGDLTRLDSTECHSAVDDVMQMNKLLWNLIW